MFHHAHPGRTGITQPGQADSLRKAEILNKDENTDIPDKSPNPHSEMPSINVGTKGVYKILIQLNIYKGTGPDEVYCPILKEMATKLAPLLQLLFQASLDQRHLPQEWMSANVVSVFKKGRRTARADP
jgi:hypothetical protein